MKFSGFHSTMHILHREEQRLWSICLGQDVNAEAMAALRQRHKDAGINPAPSYTAMVVKAIGMAIAEVREQYPEISAMTRRFLWWRWIHEFKEPTAGVAISRTEGGQDQAMAGVVPAPHRTGLVDITEYLRDISVKPLHEVPYMKNCYYLFRSPSVIQRILLWAGRSFPRNRELYRGTYTLTSVGKYGVDYQFSLPQASCLQFGFGSVKKRPVVQDDKVVPALTFTISASFDRKLMNGKPVSIVMEKVADTLENARFEQDLKRLEQAEQGRSEPEQLKSDKPAA